MERNNQAPEKPVKDDGQVLAVNSIFRTIQGEGPFVGMPATFVRLAGCNLQCPLCDTEYTTRKVVSVDDIVQIVSDRHVIHVPDLVVITGGEPFRQPIELLVNALLKEGYRVQIETNGTLYRKLDFTHERLTVVCSPKASSVNRNLLPWIAAFKYVATADSLDSASGLPVHALEHPNAKGLFWPPPGHRAEVYLQPVDEQDDERNARNLRAVVQACRQHGHRLCLQVHKIINLP